MTANPRPLAFIALRAVQKGAFADVAVNKILQAETLSAPDKRLLTELVYGCVRRQRTLDALIDELGHKKSEQQPPDLRLILHLGLYQLAYLDHIPASAAVNTTVELAKQNGFTGLAGVVNGILRQYVRQAEQMRQEGKKAGGQESEAVHDSTVSGRRYSTPSSFVVRPLPLTVSSASPVRRLAILHSYPDWMVQGWVAQFGFAETERLCEWMNQPPPIDLRVNRLRASVEQVEAALGAAGVEVKRLPLPDALRLMTPAGAIADLPGFQDGWWMVQDSSAQLVSLLLDPQPGETVIDACAAPGGKAIHIAELMNDTGIIWACDKTPSRLRKLQQNCDRLRIQSIRLHTGDSRNQTQFTGIGDRVLLDAPCSGLGTLHRHADARWRQTPDSVQDLAQLQTELLNQAATWVKPNGTLVYATCTLHPTENEQVIERFLATHPTCTVALPPADSPLAQFVTAGGYLKVLPHQHEMDGFFMVRLKKGGN